MTAFNKLEWLWKKTDVSQCTVLFRNMPGRKGRNHDKPQSRSPVFRSNCIPKRESKMLPLGTTSWTRMRGAAPPILTTIIDIHLNTGTNLPLFIANEVVSVNKLIVLICVPNTLYAVSVTRISQCSHRQRTHMKADRHLQIVQSCSNHCRLVLSPSSVWNRNPLDNWSGITPRTFSIVLNHDRRWRKWLTLHAVIPTYSILLSHPDITCYTHNDVRLTQLQPPSKVW